MNHERDHEHPSQDLGPHHRAGPADEPQPSPGDAYVAEIVENAPIPEAGRIIEHVYAKCGTAFALYLALDGVDRYARDYGPGHEPEDPAEPQGIETDFKNAYYGRFEDREAIVDDTIASFDWGSDLRRLLRGHPDLAQMVILDRDAIWSFACTHYEIIDGIDGLYLFERWP
ncbi:MAG: hypothetical protein ACSLEW_07555 [Nocardioides sp.]